MGRRTLLHGVWEDFGDEGESLPGLCYAGPLGDGFRNLLGPKARLLTTFEAGSHYEAMTIYHRIVGFEPYTTAQPWHYQPYPEEWLAQQGRI